MFAHRASITLAVALLPNIQIVNEPLYPQCSNSIKVAVMAKCEIKKTTEAYTVQWIVHGNISETREVENKGKYVFWYTIFRTQLTVADKWFDLHLFFA